MPISFEYGLVGIITILIAGFICSLFCHKLEKMQ